MRVSAALIVKNEERLLPRCLSSIRPHVDEIVVVDTGSTDQTLDVARRFSDRVMTCTWRRDFSKARQHAFDHATGDWIFWVDADDVVTNAERIRPAVESAPPDVKALYWKYVVGRDEYGNSTCEFWRERCVRNDGSFRWAGRVHEVLVPRAAGNTLRVDDIVVYHLPEHKPDRSRRNLDILREEYSRTRHHPSSRLLLNLANEYADLGETATAIDFFLKYARISTWNDERYFAHLKLARLFRQQGRFEEAADTALQAVKTNPFWGNAYFSLAQTYYYQGQWDRVAHWAELGKSVRQPDTLCIVNPREYTYDWIIYYTNALYHLGRTRDALEWTERALNICPGATWHITNRHIFLERIRAVEPLQFRDGKSLQPGEAG
jgi:glycosyltransferase involved in cell wall biosynthesis